MTKRKSNTKQKLATNSSSLLGVIIVAFVVLVGILFLLNQNSITNQTTATQPQKISPQSYQSDYQTTNTAHLLLDVRNPEEFASGHIAGAINIPVEELSKRLSEVPSDKDIVIYCRSGNRSAQAANILSNSGYGKIYDMGGIIAWQQAGYAIE